MQQFRNTAMKQAIKSLRQDENPITIQHMRDCLVVGQLLVPAQWDKDPVKDNHGQMVFSPDTKFQLMVMKATIIFQCLPVWKNCANGIKMKKCNLWS